MAETLGVEYSAIVKAAVIPAILYFASAFWMVHLEAGKYGLVGMKKDEIPSAWKALVNGWFLVLPLAALVYMLFEGFTPLYAGSMGLALTVALILGASIVLGFSNTALRYIFWIGLALIAGSLFQLGNGVVDIRYVAAVVAGLVLIAALTQGGRATLVACRDSLADSAKSALTVGMACAIVGTIIGMMTQTGVGTIFGSWVIGLGEKSLFLALIMTMLLSILLGTGIPTIPTYIIVAALAAPALFKLGVPLIISHMFAFYYGIMADLSPPVALAALAAAPIAKENPDKIGWEAMRIALAGYVIPFIAVYSPALMLQNGDPRQLEFGFYGAVVYATIKALIAIGLFGMVAIGFLFTRMSVVERVAAFAAALFLLGEFDYSDPLGLVVAIAVVIWQWRKRAALTPVAA
jgi:TRAP transporter 4TM/12TM fusion protein